ncbi:MAG: hypothetical protein IPL62_05465 [Caulobacteraceae bacterium]|nr:hypothetical protein [Caulobacteraceae bacterium]MBK8543053.1 hypothetical protein [Caulobacteraceae bacterium]MBP6688623.1 hypothetical protein [Hyphomonadaceae bacterium]
MRKSGKTIRLNPVDDDHVMDHPARAGMEAIMDQKLFAQRIRSERASAYWFAASLWGVTGLVLGAILGGFMMYVAMNSSLPLASEAVSRGMAVEQARQRVDDSAPALRDPAEQQP